LLSSFGVTYSLSYYTRVTFELTQYIVIGYCLPRS
jgi:hypothetical protein